MIFSLRRSVAFEELQNSNKVVVLFSVKKNWKRKHIKAFNPVHHEIKCLNYHLFCWHYHLDSLLNSTFSHTPSSTGSQDVAQSKQTLDEYEITHILNLDGAHVDNYFEDDYNYLTLDIIDSAACILKNHFDDVFDFIDEGRQRGNCFVHCNTEKPGLSRSTAFCIAYLMHKFKKGFTDAFNEVKIRQ